MRSWWVMCPQKPRIAEAQVHESRSMSNIINCEYAGSANVESANVGEREERERKPERKRRRKRASPQVSKRACGARVGVSSVDE